MSNPEPTLNPSVRWLRVLFLSLWVAGGIGMASLKWDWSIDFLLSSDQDYEFRDNTLAQQRAGLNRWLIVGYSCLAFLGIASIAARGSFALPKFKAWHLLPICLLLWCGTSLIWSVEPGLTVRRIGHLYMAVLGGIGLVALLDRREILWTLTFIFSSLCLIGIVAELSLGMFHPWRSGYRFCGVGHPNETALFAVTAVLSGRVLWLMESVNKTRSLFSMKNVAILVVLVCGVLLILTRSRTTMLSGIAALFIIQYAYAQSINAWLFVTGSASVAVITGLVLAVVPTSIYNAFFGIATVGRSTHVGSLTGRIPLWEEILKHWQREPMLGYGYGGYWTTKRVEDFAQMFYWEPPNGHSIYVDSLVETGPIGLLLLITTLVAMMIFSFVEYPKAKHFSHLFVIGITSLMVIHGLAESSFFKGCYGPLVFTIAACLLTAKPNRKSRMESSSPKHLQLTVAATH